MENDFASTPLSVSEFISLTNDLLKLQKFSIIGEVFEISFPASGHVYFTLRDKKENAVIKCVIWRTTYQMQGVKLQTGLEVILTGRMEIYAPYGRIQYMTSSVELVGEGQLKIAYDLLKKQLTAEGIFAEERKRPLPLFPKRVGIITSQIGAVIHDFSNNVGRHDFKFHLCDSRIEGKQSLPDILSAIKTMSQQDIELLIIMRGGGSLQSLGAFDTEAMVRAVNDFPVPVIAAIGHHQDVTLAALAADVHVSTPTAAAMLLNKSWDDASLTLSNYGAKIVTRYSEGIQNASYVLQESKYSIEINLKRIIEVFSNAQKKVEMMIMKSLFSISQARLKLQQQTDHITVNFTRQITTADHMLHATLITNAVTTAIESTEKQLSHCEQIITLRDPRRMLQYGYSIIRSGTTLVKSIRDVQTGDDLNIMMTDGELVSTMKGIKHE